MKPNFALKLSNDGAELLHRQPAGWSRVGGVSFETDDVAQGCARLMGLAAELEPAGQWTKVVIPASEVRYTSVVAPGPTDEARRYQIEAEIERLTPYTIDELTYDWVVEGDSALVVICARETLAEAETFAEDYGFHPVSFVAQPDPGQFVGEPWFGETRVAKAHLPTGQRVQRDVDAIRLVAERPAAARAAAPAAAAVAGAAAAPPPVVAQPPAAAPIPAAPISAAPAAAAPVVAPPVAAAAKAAEPAAAKPPALAPGAVAQTVVDQPPVQPRPPATPFTPPSPALAAPKAMVSDMVRRFGTRLRRERADEDAVAAPVAPPAITPPAAANPTVATIPSAASDAAPVAFSSRRGNAAPQPVRDIARPAALSDNAPAPRDAAANPGGRLAVLRRPDAAQSLGAVKAWAQRLRAKAASLAPAKPLVGAIRARSQALSAQAGALSKSRANRSDPSPIVPASRPPASERDRSREQEALTIFGARGNPMPEPSLARRGLAAAGGLLLILIAVAVWMLYFNSDSQTQIAAPATDTPLAAIEPPRQIAPSPVAAAAPVETPPAPATDTAETPTTAAVDPDSLLEALVDEARAEDLPTQIATGTETPAPADPIPAEPAADVAEPAQPVDQPSPEPQIVTAEASDPQQAAPASTNDSPLATAAGSAETRLALPRPMVLPPVTEAAFDALPPPPPFGATFTFDAQGLVEATPDGALTPSGVTVFARRPPAVPAPAPARPADTAAIAPVSPEPAVADAPTPGDALTAALTEALSEPVAEPAAAPAPVEVIYDDTPRADPALSRFRPQPRPERLRAVEDPATTPTPDDQTGLAPPPASGESPSDLALDTTAPDASPDTPPPGGVSLAALRPQPRPSDFVSEPAAPELDLTGATPQAVAQSPVPGARPRAVEERARRILAAAAQAPATQTAAAAPARAAAPALDEDDEGETASSTNAPAIPSTASVARQATETNALRLNQINLIGVFGAPGDRRALVRLSSGRVVRVQVGDRIDGGQVSAIGESDLRYTSSGREQILRIGG